MAVPVIDAEHSHCEALLGNLPAFPPVAGRLLELLGDDQAPIDEAVDLIRSDAALSADLLRRANSPLYGCAARIDTLRQCLTILGFDEIRKVVITLATSSFAGDAIRIPELHRCWRHTLAVAVLSEELAKAAAFVPDKAYTAGLMHDIGRLGILVAKPKEYSALLRKAEADGEVEDSIYLLELEREAFGVDHAEAGRWLTEQWRMPVELQLVAGRHHDRLQGEDGDLLSVVHRGCKMADALGFEVVRSMRPQSFAEIRAELPHTVRKQFWSSAEKLREHIEIKVDAVDPNPPAETSRRQRASDSKAAHAAPEAADDAVDGAASDPVEEKSDWATVGWTLIILLSLAFAVAFAVS